MFSKVLTDINMAINYFFPQLNYPVLNYFTKQSNGSSHHGCMFSNSSPKLSFLIVLS